MNKLLLTSTLTLLAATTAAADDTWRCGQSLISTGDRSFEVIQRCGTPAIRDVVGYTTDDNGNRQMQIEEWVYGPESGAYHILTFIGNQLKTIEFRRN